jgi:hypothetical protein
MKTIRAFLKYARIRCRFGIARVPEQFFQEVQLGLLYWRPRHRYAEHLLFFLARRIFSRPLVLSLITWLAVFVYAALPL